MKNQMKKSNVDDVKDGQELTQDQLDQAAGGGSGAGDSVWMDLGSPIVTGSDSSETGRDSTTSARLNDPAAGEK